MKSTIRNLFPIVVFACNRICHLKKTINSLKKCNLSKNSKLIIYLDHHKEDKKVSSLAKQLTKF